MLCRVMKIWCCCMVSVVLMGAAVSADTSAMSVKIGEALELVDVSPGDPSLCVITDAGYVKLDGVTTERYIDVIREATGCSVGKRNLLFLHRPTTYHLKVALFNKDTARCVFIDDKGNGPVVGPVADIGFDTLGDDAAWERACEAAGASDAFGFVMTAHAWAAGAPYDYLKCAELHNHLCPGVTSGYFIARYVQAHYPLKEKESYRYIACPCWCKDDALQIIMGLTPGKKRFTVKNLSEDQLDALVDEPVAGIMIIEGTEGGGKAVVLSFDWDAMNGAAGSAPYEGIQSRIKTITGIVAHLDSADEFVSVLAEKNVTAEQITLMAQAGVNPYEVLEFVKK